MKIVDHDKRREEVATAAAAIIADQGIEALTTRKLAGSLSLSQGTVAYYFKNKEEIVIAALRLADQRMEQRLDDLARNQPSTLEDFITLLGASMPMDEQSDREWRVRLNMATYGLTHEELGKTHEALIRERHRKIDYVIEMLQERNELRRGLDPSAVSKAAYNLVHGVAFTLIHLPMAERVNYLEPLMSFIDTLRPE